MSPRAPIAAVLAATVLAGCGGGGGPGATTATAPATEGRRTLPLTTSGPPPAPPPAPSPFAPGVLPRVVATLARQVGSAPRFRAIFVGPEHVTLLVLDPRTRARVDSYLWRAGTIEGPWLGTRQDAAGLPLFGARDVRLGALSRLVALGDRLPIAGSRTVNVTIEPGVSADGRLGFLVNVGGDRESRQIVADARGRVQMVR